MGICSATNGQWNVGEFYSAWTVVTLIMSVLVHFTVKKNCGAPQKFGSVGHNTVDPTK